MRIKTPKIGRTVTYGVIGLLVAICLASVEFYPLTSMHLFTGIRTSNSVRNELIVIVEGDEDPTRIPLSFGGRGEVLARTTHHFAQLPFQDPQRQAEMIDAWLELAHIDKEAVTAIQLERVRREMGETSGVWHEVEREVTWQAQP